MARISRAIATLQRGSPPSQLCCLHRLSERQHGDSIAVTISARAKAAEQQDERG